MASEIPPISLKNYQYDLPGDRIAKYPLVDRDQSKLLVWKGGEMTHQVFSQLSDFLPINSTLFFNNTKVIPARIMFEKNTGASIEVFLLNPSGPLERMAESLQSKGHVTWVCAVGNMKRWGTGQVLHKTLGAIDLHATWEDRSMGSVRFSWTPGHFTFAQVVEVVGAVPLPPYIKRQAEQMDRDRYQTIYSRFEGAVAAPTAGLHFTTQTLDDLKAHSIPTDYLTLHVSAGTFLPVKEENAAEHEMHEEEIIIYKHNIINMLRPGRRVIAVGTTALRTLESIYWFGTLLLRNPQASFMVDQDLPYQAPKVLPSSHEALCAVLDRLTLEGADQMTGRTSLYIVPGYTFKICQGLVTNFHQPGSTLLLLVSAFIGNDWKRVYQEALQGGYRFLSYGDSSLLLP